MQSSMAKGVSAGESEIFSLRHFDRIGHFDLTQADPVEYIVHVSIQASRSCVAPISFVGFVH